MKRRVTMQVSLNFDNLIKDIQREIMIERGERKSTVDITEELRKSDLKKFILNKADDIEISFDRRRR